MYRRARVKKKVDIRIPVSTAKQINMTVLFLYLVKSDARVSTVQ